MTMNKMLYYTLHVPCCWCIEIEEQQEEILSGLKVQFIIFFIPCLPLEMSTYWQSLGWIKVLRIWNRPRILMELGVRGRPLLPQTSWGRAEAKKVKAPSCASLRVLILCWWWEQQVFTIYLIYTKNISAKRYEWNEHWQSVHTANV